MAWTSRAPLLLPVILPAIGALLTAPRAARADGDDRAASVSAGYATFSEPGKTTNAGAATTITPSGGGSLSGIYEHGISTDISLRAELGGALFYGGTSENSKNTSHLSFGGLGDVGLTFRFDVLRYVPYAFGGFGATWSTGGPLNDSWTPVIVVGGGLDVLQSRSWSWGIEGRVTGFMSDTTMFTIGLRGTIRWGYL